MYCRLADQQSLKSDIRYARSTDDGNTNVDNTALRRHVHLRPRRSTALGLGYQQMNGDTGFAYVAGTDAFLVNFVQIGDFAFKDEKSWQARYDYNFAGHRHSRPDLHDPLRQRATTSTSGRSRCQSEGKEWERNTDIAYVIQDGPLKNVGFKWRNATVRSNFGNDLDENRFIVSYILPLW